MGLISSIVAALFFRKVRTVDTGGARLDDRVSDGPDCMIDEEFIDLW